MNIFFHRFCLIPEYREHVGFAVALIENIIDADVIIIFLDVPAFLATGPIDRTFSLSWRINPDHP